MADKILVVDDEAEIADLIEAYLTAENLTVYKFCSAREALACAASTELDLAILDVMLPDMDGFTLCKKIREAHTWPIIMLTAKDAETDKITGLTLGADDYVTKPFRPLELAARVKSQLRRCHRYNPAYSGPPDPDPAAGAILCGGLALTATHPPGEPGPGRQLRRAVPADLAGRVLQQVQQHHHGPHPAPAGEAGGPGGERQVHQNRVGGGV